MPSFKTAVLVLTLLLKSSIFAQNSRLPSSNTRKLKQNKTKKSNTTQDTEKSKKSSGSYEVWASDQSNSVPGETSVGVNGSYLWIWDSGSIDSQLEEKGDASPLSCTPNTSSGPCDVFDVFPRTLEEMHANGATGRMLGDMPKFGRLHGMLKDPQNRYITTNMYAPAGGFVGVMDAKTKEAIALFRVTEFNQTSNKVSVHMSIWSSDGSAIIVDNLHGKAIERIDVTRDENGIITALDFNKSATIGLGKGTEVTLGATYFSGKNAFGNNFLGNISGDYISEGLADLTPNGFCKENGCTSGPDGNAGGRENNVPICPIPSSNDNAYVTLGGGGLFVLDITSEPMVIEGEYGKAVIHGAGCGGIEANGSVFINAGSSGAGSGFDDSTFTIYAADDSAYDRSNPENYPLPDLVFQDPNNTRTLGNPVGPESNSSGQLPGISTRRDSHGAAVTLNGMYLHVVDRVQNIVEVFNTKTFKHENTYDLVSKDGQSGRSGPAAACRKRSILDDGGLPLNDPAPDLMEITPDGKYLAVAFRGPVPVSVSHTAQGSCPGVGIVKLIEGGKSGQLVDVLRTTNTVDDVVDFSIPNGYPYVGTERSDIHSAMVISATDW